MCRPAAILASNFYDALCKSDTSEPLYIHVCQEFGQLVTITFFFLSSGAPEMSSLRSLIEDG